MIELFSAKAEAEPSEEVKPAARPLEMEETRVMELIKDLESKFFSARPDAEPIEAVR